MQYSYSRVLLSGTVANNLMSRWNYCDRATIILFNENKFAVYFLVSRRCFRVRPEKNTNTNTTTTSTTTPLQKSLDSLVAPLP